MYDARPFTDPDPRVPGFHGVYCRLTWIPADADTSGAVVVGAYLDADSPFGPVSLGCGIESALDDLGIADLVEYEHLAGVAELVSRQLRRRPHAKITCRQGTAMVELERRRGRAPQRPAG